MGPAFLTTGHYVRVGQGFEIFLTCVKVFLIQCCGVGLSPRRSSFFLLYKDKL